MKLTCFCKWNLIVRQIQYDALLINWMGDLNDNIFFFAKRDIFYAKLESHKAIKPHIHE